MRLVFGGLSFPLVPSGTQVAQPFTDLGLPYLQDCINHYVGAAFAVAMAGQISGQASELACQETGISNPDLQASKVTFATPYLALWAEDGTVAEFTTSYDWSETRYALQYILPPLPFEVVQKVSTPLLQALQKLLVLLLKQGGDDCHRSGARIWEEAGITKVRMGRWQIIAHVLGEDIRTAQAFPMLQAEVFVTEQEGDDLEDGAGPLQVNAGVSVGGEDPSDPPVLLVETQHIPDP